MARPSADSQFRAPIARPEPNDDIEDTSFERALLGFCVSSLLDQMAALGETRASWADRLELSKSHISKMAEAPTKPFLAQFDLALSVSGRVKDGERLNPLLSDYAAELLPGDRHEGAGLVLRWLARYRPEISPELKAVLLDSEVALDRCRLLGRRGRPDYDDFVRDSIRNLLLVVSGPYRGSVISHFQCAELGLHVPEAFFDELDETLNRSPLGFRVLRTVDRLVRRRRSLGADRSIQGRQVLDAHLTKLLRRIARASSAGTFIDPYPGSEWAIALARECLRLGGPELTAVATQWLFEIAENHETSDRARLYAAWVVAAHGSNDERARAVEVLADEGASSYLNAWSSLVGHGTSLLGVNQMYDDVDTYAGAVDGFEKDVRSQFGQTYALIVDKVDEFTGTPSYTGVREALVSLIFSALITPDGRIRRALIEGVANAGLVTPTANVLASLLDIDASEMPETPTLAESALRETAIFLLGRLRQPSPPPSNGTTDPMQRLLNLLILASDDPDHGVRHAAVWAIGDLWKKGLDPVPVSKELGDIVLKGQQPLPTRLAATNVIAVMAHEELHDVVNQPLPDQGSRASAKKKRLPGPAEMKLREIFEAEKDGEKPGASVIRAVCAWATWFGPNRGFTTEHLLTLDGLLDGNVTEQDNLQLQGDPESS